MECLARLYLVWGNKPAPTFDILDLRVGPQGVGLETCHAALIGCMKSQSETTINRATLEVQTPIAHL
jgi:hypothetical protein